MIPMNFSRPTAACFTGHRPQKLPFGFDELDPRCAILKDDLSHHIQGLINRGFDTFFCGGAMGVDMFCGEITLAFREQFPNIKLCCVVPCADQSHRWSDSYQKRHSRLLHRADCVVTLHPRYVTGCMHERNKLMVDNSSLVLAVCSNPNGSGGTASTIKYARSKGLSVVLVSTTPREAGRS